MHRELAAPAELRQYIQCFWVHAVGPDEPARVHRILPDGCIDAISCLDAEPVARLSERLGISSRQLLRRFELGVGYGPSLFRRVVRLQLVVHSAVPQGPRRLAHLPANAGYADQAHMNRDIRQLAGVTAGELLAGY